MPIDPIPDHTAHHPSDDLVGRIAQGAHQTIDRLAESAAPHVRSLQDGLAGGSDAVRSGDDPIRQASDEWAETLRSTVRDHPLASLGVALAVGVLLARVSR